MDKTMLDALDEVYTEVSEQPEYAELPHGTYTGVLTKVELKEVHWKKSNIDVPVVSLTLTVSEGDFVGSKKWVNLNLRGTTPESTNISLSVFKRHATMFGIDSSLSLSETVEAFSELVDNDVTVVFETKPQKKNPEYDEVVIKEVC